MGGFGRVAAWTSCVGMALLLLAWPTAAQEPLKGVALVVGNGDYAHLAKLANPPDDARAIEAMLDRLGFDTTLVSDRNARRLRRDLEGFVEDAEGADVAILYYAGHGIEAGGENFLVPVDADLSALEAAGERLVPLTEMLDGIKASVPVTIVMLDACRTNPFPPGATLRVEPGAWPVPAGAGGLAATRGAAPLADSRGDDSFGTVIGFAAEPGHVALDGPAGGNSPYAAAILRHLGAIGGAEFGTVMRMVAEEVYLKTGGRQRPWVNESLRRLLYFGGEPEEPAAEAGAILAERRKLLVTIAALPEPGRRQIEAIAQSAAVPMDALYGMLAVLGEKAPSDPAELDRLLRGQTERLKSLLAERALLATEDAEITRLAGLADQALAEGALTSAVELMSQAKARVASLQASVDDAEAEIAAKRREFAAVYARSGAAHALVFDHLAAAGDYAMAFAEVERWDDQLAWTYKNAETLALVDHGTYRGDNAALIRALEAGRVALRIAEGDGFQAATSQNNIGNALQALGARETGTERLGEAAAAYAEAIAAWQAAGEAERWATAQNNLGNALQALGEREAETATLDRSVAAYRAALTVLTPDSAPVVWATALNNMGNALAALGQRAASAERLQQAVEAYELALEGFPRETVPFYWAATQNNLGKALLALGDMEAGPAPFEAAAAAFRLALEESPRDRVPLNWATMKNNLGIALQSLGLRATEAKAAAALHRDAAAAYREALGEMTRERVPLQWASVQTNLANALQSLAVHEPDAAAHLAEAAAAQRAALEVFSRKAAPLQWATVQHNLGGTLMMLAHKGDNAALFREAEAAYRLALEERTLARTPVDWGRSRMGVSDALLAAAEQAKDPAGLREARRIVVETRDSLSSAGFRFDAYFADRLARLDAALEMLGAE